TNSANYKQISDNLFKAVGETVWVKSEQELNNAMAISGCGPAYVFLVIESLMQAAINVDIEPALAKKLIAETILGATEFFSQSDKTAEDLRKAVTSPNGTTAAALNILNIEQTKNTYKSAILAAIDRAKQIEHEQFN